jgi:hypothetical protein
MKKEDGKIWFGLVTKLLERIGDSFSQQALKLTVPRDEKRGQDAKNLI